MEHVYFLISVACLFVFIFSVLFGFSYPSLVAISFFAVTGLVFVVLLVLEAVLWGVT